MNVLFIIYKILMLYRINKIFGYKKYICVNKNETDSLSILRMSKKKKKTTL